MALDRILRNGQILEIAGVSNATLYRWIRDGRFPAPVRLGPNSVGWRESAIQEWLDGLQPIPNPATAAEDGE